MFGVCVLKMLDQLFIWKKLSSPKNLFPILAFWWKSSGSIHNYICLSAVKNHVWITHILGGDALYLGIFPNNEIMGIPVIGNDGNNKFMLWSFPNPQKWIPVGIFCDMADKFCEVPLSIHFFLNISPYSLLLFAITNHKFAKRKFLIPTPVFLRPLLALFWKPSPSSFVPYLAFLFLPLIKFKINCSRRIGTLEHSLFISQTHHWQQGHNIKKNLQAFCSYGTW